MNLVLVLVSCLGLCGQSATQKLGNHTSVRQSVETQQCKKLVVLNDIPNGQARSIGDEPLTKMQIEILHHLDDQDLSYWEKFTMGHCPPALLKFVVKLKLAVVQDDPRLMSELIKFPARVGDGSGSRILGRKQFLSRYLKLMTPSFRKMILRSDVSRMRESPDGTWAIFAGYGDLWVRQSENNSEFKIIAMDNECLPIYRTTSKEEDWLSRDYHVVEKLVNQIRSSDGDLSNATIKEAIISPIVRLSASQTQVLPLSVVSEKDLDFIRSMLLSVNTPEKLSKMDHVGPYSVYRIGTTAEYIGIEVIYLNDDPKSPEGHPVVKIFSMKRP